MSIQENSIEEDSNKVIVKYTQAEHNHIKRIIQYFIKFAHPYLICKRCGANNPKNSKACFVCGFDKFDNIEQL